jgi:hypothetical protein
MNETSLSGVLTRGMVPDPPQPRPMLPQGAYPSYPEFTPEELNLYWHGMGNQYRPDRVVSPTGDVSTVLQATVPGPGGRQYSIPTVWDAQALTVDESIARAAQKGWQHWPSYSNPETADYRYGLLHKYMDQAGPTDRALRGPQGLGLPR